MTTTELAGCLLPVLKFGFVWIFLLGLAAEAFVDLREMIIPDEILALLAPAALGYAALGMRNWHDTLSGALLGAALFGAIYVLSHGGLGLGDVKFAAVLGLWLGVNGLLAGLAVAFLSGGCAALVLCISGRANLQSKVPFAPFLSLGGAVSFFYASRIADWYRALFL